MDKIIAQEAVKSLEEAKSQTIEDIKQLQVKLEGFEVSIAWFNQFVDNHNIDESIKKNADGIELSYNNIAELNVTDNSQFPIKGDRKAQIIFTLNQLGRFVKLKTLGSEIKDQLNVPDLKSDTFLRTPVGAMVEQGELVAIRYNGNWKKLFYGLPGWIIDGEDGKEIKNGYSPLSDEIGYGLDQVEFDFEPRKFNKDGDKSDLQSNQGEGYPSEDEDFDEVEDSGNDDLPF